MNLNDIIEAILANWVRITDHADEEAEDDNLSFDEIYFSVLYGEIIENYPKEKPYPRYLIYGESFRGEPIVMLPTLTGRVLRRLMLVSKTGSGLGVLVGLGRVCIIDC